VNEARGDKDHRVSRGVIEQRFLVNSRLIIAARVVTASLSLATIPVLVSHIGVVGYGTWEALLALASLSSVFQLAISGALVWRVSEAYGRHDTAEIRRLMRLGAGACLVLFVLLWPVAWFLREPAVHFLRVPAQTQALASMVFPIVAALILLGGVSITLEAVVSGCQRTGLVNVVGAAAQILNYSVVIILAVRGAGVWGLVVGQVVGFAARLAGAWVATRVSFGAVSLTPTVPIRTDLSLARYSGLMIVGSLAAALRDQTDKLVLASLASPAWVGYYGIAARLAGLVMEVSSFVYVPILTAVGALNATGDWHGVQRLYTRLMAMVSIVSGLVVVLVAGLANRFVILWIGHPISEVTLLLWLLMTGSASAVMLTGPGTAVCRGIGRVGIETIYLVFNLVLNLVLTISLVLVIGPIGTAVATGTTWALSSLLFLLVLHKALDLPAAASRRAAGTAVLAAVVACIVFSISQAFGLPDGRRAALASLVVWGAASGLVYFALAISFRLVSVTEAYGGLRSVFRRTG